MGVRDGKIRNVPLGIDFRWGARRCGRSCDAGCAVIKGPSYSATIGGGDSKVLFLGLAPCFVRLHQTNLAIQTGLAAGIHEVVVTVAGNPSNAALITTK